MRALVRFLRGTIELQPVAGDVLNLSKGHAALLGPTASVITGPVNIGGACVYEADFADALLTVALPPVTEKDAYTDSQIGF